MLNNSYETSPVKRKRATKAEMIERANFVADFTREFAPVTVRQVFYAATVNNIIEKTDDGPFTIVPIGQGALGRPFPILVGLRAYNIL
jgi:hypothetical protein